MTLSGQATTGAALAGWMAGGNLLTAFRAR